jgi:hypothetical protein
MADKRQSREVEGVEDEGPKQTVSRLPDDQPDVGPYYPSGMSAPEAAYAGATADMSDEEIAKLHGEEPTQQKSDSE